MELPALPPALEWRRCVLGAAEGPAATLFHGALVSPRCEDVTRLCVGPVCPHSGYSVCGVWCCATAQHNASFLALVAHFVCQCDNLLNVRFVFFPVAGCTFLFFF